MQRHPFVAAVAAAALLATPFAAGAQGVDFRPLPLLGGERDDLDRVAGLAGDSSRYLTLRSPSRLMRRGSSRWAIAPLTPELFVSHNSALPWGFNDGALWQGRGLNLRATGGAVAEYAAVRVVIAPQLVSSANRPYQVIPFFARDTVDRSPWANPFHPTAASIDLPLRYGDAPETRVDPGQSGIWVTAGGVEAGLTTENVWWGPGVQNSLLVGSHAAGVPAFSLRTARPIATRTGTWDAWWMIGALAESSFFDDDATNDTRTLAGGAVTWRPPGAAGFEAGLARIVIAEGAPGAGAIVYPLQSVGRPNSADSLDAGSRDQITSLWARWARPGAGFEAWGELARFEEPGSLRDLLEYPGHSQGYTLGLQWRRPLAASVVRLWAEGTYVEPSPSIRVRHVEASYVSRAVPQGFTQRGQALAAGIGPGSSSQWVAGDWLHSRWRIGAFAARVRTDNAALFTAAVPQVRREDISLTGGLRGGGEWRGIRVLAEWSRTARLNYLFQAYLMDPATGRTEGIDIVNNFLALTLSAPWRSDR